MIRQRTAVHPPSILDEIHVHPLCPCVGIDVSSSEPTPILDQILEENPEMVARAFRIPDHAIEGELNG